MRRTIAAVAVATAFIVALATVTVSGAFSTVSADAPPIPGVGSTWTYLVDYEDDTNGYYEYDHPFHFHLVEHNAMPPSGVCITTPPAVPSYHFQIHTSPDAGCPGCTVPTRYVPGGTPIQTVGPYEVYASMSDLTLQWLVVPQCLSSMTPMTAEQARDDYTGTQPGRPYIAGESWSFTRTQYTFTSSSCLAPQGGTWTCTETVEAVGVTVTVPAGTFSDCVHITTTCEGECLSEVWWSPTVMGAVKWVYPESYYNGIETWELASYTIAPPTPPVGGTIVPTDKLGLVAPWIMAAALIVAAGVSLAVWNRKRGGERASGR